MDGIGPEIFLMAALFFIVAVTYSSVGHAGASGYMAVMACFSVSPFVMRPTSLVLNLVVGSIGLYRFGRAGLINLKVIGPFLAASAPVAYFSSQLQVDRKYFSLVLAIVLFFSGLRLLLGNKSFAADREVREVPFFAALASGGVIGLLSGLTGTGGAVFLTPLLLAMRWAEPRQASGLSIVFVLANSASGLAGLWSSSPNLDLTAMSVWTASVVVGAFVGTHFGVSRFSNRTLQTILGVVLLVAVVKLLIV